jgi:hypothetical protein
MLYKFTLQKSSKFRKVFHIRYISFSVMIEGDKTRGIFREDIKEYWVQVLDLDSLQVQSYTC